ncbi:hypothetical protein ABZP36_022648 [Zizania latifolia]
MPLAAASPVLLLACPSGAAASATSTTLLACGIRRRLCPVGIEGSKDSHMPLASSSAAAASDWPEPQLLSRHQRHRSAAAAAEEGEGCTSRPTLPEWKFNSSGDGDDDDEAGPSEGNPRPTTRSHASARDPNRATAAGLVNARRCGGADSDEPEERSEIFREVIHPN